MAQMGRNAAGLGVRTLVLILLFRVISVISGYNPQ